jgi:hypothetical protein
MTWRPTLLSLSLVFTAVHCIDPAIKARGVNMADTAENQPTPVPAKKKSDPASLSLDLN